MSDNNTLAMPLSLCYTLWSPLCDETANPLLTPFNQLNASCTRQHCETKDATASSSPSSSLPHPHGGESKAKALPHIPRMPCLTKIGTAFERCFYELRYFVGWDSVNCCIRVNESCQVFVDDKLREFGFYEDANGDYSELWAPRYSTFTVCQYGHRTLATPAIIRTTSSSGETATQTIYRDPDNINSSPCTTCESTCGTATAAARADSASARVRSKQREQIQDALLLSDCSPHTDSSAKRTYMSIDTPLKQLMRQLNRAVLRYGYGTHKGDNLIWVELAGLVGLLNYAAVFLDRRWRAGQRSHAEKVWPRGV